MEVEEIKAKKIFIYGLHAAVKITIIVQSNDQDISIEQEAKLIKFLETL